MDTRDWLTVSAYFNRRTKPQLVDYLIANGTVYPTRANMLKWLKDELVNDATRCFLNVDANAGQTPA